MDAMVAADPRSVRMADVDEPVPADHQALMAVDAYSVNRGETFLLDNAAAGWRPGKDIAGTVIRAARDGSSPPAGTRVVAHVPASGWARRAAVAVSQLAVLPDGVAATTAAALPLAGLTAARLLRRIGSPIGRRLLITGASGGVGHYLVELAHAAGADVTAVAATAKRGARLRELGARTVTDVEYAEGRFDVAMDSVGGATFVTARRKVRPDGTVIWFGQASLEPVSIDFFDWVEGTVGARIEPFHYARGDDAADLRTLVAMVSDGRLHPEIGRVAPWCETARVVDEIRDRRIRGNAVLTVTTDDRTER